mmetsp:Transcript_39258/g.121356  ORF Transcript_39258/g.121356 Transcript_39258/m.121356 type:complete len:288 (-) Transcript_39258:368-1231(-)
MQHVKVRVPLPRRLGHGLRDLAAGFFVPDSGLQRLELLAEPQRHGRECLHGLCSHAFDRGRVARRRFRRAHDAKQRPRNGAGAKQLQRRPIRQGDAGFSGVHRHLCFVVVHLGLALRGLQQRPRRGGFGASGCDGAVSCLAFGQHFQGRSLHGLGAFRGRGLLRRQRVPCHDHADQPEAGICDGDVGVFLSHCFHHIRSGRRCLEIGGWGSQGSDELPQPMHLQSGRLRGICATAAAPLDGLSRQPQAFAEVATGFVTHPLHLLHLLSDRSQLHSTLPQCSRVLSAR